MVIRHSRRFLVLPLAFAFAVLAADARAELRLFGDAAVGEAEWHPADDLGGSGALWQGGLSLDAVSPFAALTFLSDWYPMWRMEFGYRLMAW